MAISFQTIKSRFIFGFLFLVSSITDINCTQPAIDDFPRDLFTEPQRQAGAVVLHVIASLYLFVALAVVCDEYFVPAVEKICAGRLD